MLGSWLQPRSPAKAFVPDFSGRASPTVSPSRPRAPRRASTSPGRSRLRLRPRYAVQKKIEESPGQFLECAIKVGEKARLTCSSVLNLSLDGRTIVPANPVYADRLTMTSPHVYGYVKYTDRDATPLNLAAEDMRVRWEHVFEGLVPGVAHFAGSNGLTVQITVVQRIREIVPCRPSVAPSGL